MPDVRPLPRALPYAWTILALLAAAEGLNEIFDLPGRNALYEGWVHDVVIVCAAVLCLLRARHEPLGRSAWLAFGLGLSCWALGDVLWSILYEGQANPPYPTVCDLFWLAWYPFTAVGMALLVRLRVVGFELHRWMDGLAVMLIVLIPGFALLLQPVAEHTDDTTLATIVDFSYPILDVVLLGAMLGIYGLLDWRPTKMWLALGAGCTLIVISDAWFAVDQARDDTTQGEFGVTLTIGALIIAFAAWRSSPHPHLHRESHGWRAIALPLAAQLLAGAIQVYGLFEELGVTERIVTLLVLFIVSVQIIVTRPRLDAQS
ncbi:MAG: putative signaling protein [Solirubrobacterales bacterium]|nr:putative signaling protein [Solirubrobacterales bacterium]